MYFRIFHMVSTSSYEGVHIIAHNTDCAWWELIFGFSLFREMILGLHLWVICERCLLYQCLAIHELDATPAPASCFIIDFPNISTGASRPILVASPAYWLACKKFLRYYILSLFASCFHFSISHFSWAAWPLLGELSRFGFRKLHWYFIIDNVDGSDFRLPHSRLLCLCMSQSFTVLLS